MSEPNRRHQPKYLSLRNFREWAISVAFGPLDAGLDAFLLYQRPSWRTRRSSLSSASARYLVQPRRGDARAWIDIRMIDANHTLILLDSSPAGSLASGNDEERKEQHRWHEQMSALIDDFLAWFDQEHARIIALAMSPASAHPLARVLAEYEHRRAAGEKLTLREIAEERGVSYSSLRIYKSKQKSEQNKH